MLPFQTRGGSVGSRSRIVKRGCGRPPPRPSHAPRPAQHVPADAPAFAVVHLKGLSLPVFSAYARQLRLHAAWPGHIPRAPGQAPPTRTPAALSLPPGVLITDFSAVPTSTSDKRLSPSLGQKGTLGVSSEVQLGQARPTARLSSLSGPGSCHRTAQRIHCLFGPATQQAGSQSLSAKADTRTASGTRGLAAEPSAKPLGVQSMSLQIGKVLRRCVPTQEGCDFSPRIRPHAGEI